MPVSYTLIEPLCLQAGLAKVPREQWTAGMKRLWEAEQLLREGWDTQLPRTEAELGCPVDSPEGLRHVAECGGSGPAAAHLRSYWLEGEACGTDAVDGIADWHRHICQLRKVVETAAFAALAVPQQLGVMLWLAHVAALQLQFPNTHIACGAAALACCVIRGIERFRSAWAAALPQQHTITLAQLDWVCAVVAARATTRALEELVLAEDPHLPSLAALHQPKVTEYKQAGKDLAMGAIRLRPDCAASWRVLARAEEALLDRPRALAAARAALRLAEKQDDDCQLACCLWLVAKYELLNTYRRPTTYGDIMALVTAATAAERRMRVWGGDAFMRVNSPCRRDVKDNLELVRQACGATSLSPATVLRDVVDCVEDVRPMRHRATLRRCSKCDTATLRAKLCAACGLAAYCSAACQKAHWREHKAACQAECTKSTTQASKHVDQS